MSEGKTDSTLLLESMEYSIKKILPQSEKYLPQIKKEIYETFKKKRESTPIPEYLKSHKKLTKFLIAQFARISDIKDIGIPEKENEQIRFITKAQLNTIFAISTAIPAIIPSNIGSFSI